MDGSAGSRGRQSTPTEVRRWGNEASSSKRSSGNDIISPANARLIAFIEFIEFTSRHRIRACPNECSRESLLSRLRENGCLEFDISTISDTNVLSASRTWRCVHRPGCFCLGDSGEYGRRDWPVGGAKQIHWDMWRIQNPISRRSRLIRVDKPGRVSATTSKHHGTTISSPGKSFAKTRDNVFAENSSNASESCILLSWEFVNTTGER
jgi:hypothetical protein